MEIGMYVFGDISAERCAELFVKYGVKRTFIESESKTFDDDVKAYYDKGITLDTLHAPFVGINDMWSDDKKKGDAMLARLIDAVDKCAKYDIPTAIVHVSSGRPMPKISEAGVKRYSYLFEYAEKKGVKIALENLRYLENLKYFMDNYTFPVFCWDTGHENCYTDGLEHMKEFGDRLGALHIHDNRGIADKDDHILPYDGAIDFERVARHIAESPYTGTIMLEVCRSRKIDGKGFYDHLSDEEYVERAVSVARKIADRVEEIRAEAK